MKAALLTLALLLSLNSFAQDNTESSSSSSDSQNEGWYFNLGFGSSSNDYPTELQSAIDSNYSDVSAMVDLGFYWPAFSNSTMLGIAMTANRTELTQILGDATASIQTTLYALSLTHFFSSRIGSGLYIRADFGASKGITEGSVVTVSDWGTGYFLGAGIAFHITSGTRMMIGGYYTSKKIEGSDYSYSGFELSFLF